MQKYLNFSKNYNVFIIQNNEIYIIYLKKDNIFFLLNYINLTIYLNYIYFIKKKYIIDILNFFFFS